jgi:hypothetical protein
MAPPNIRGIEILPAEILLKILVHAKLALGSSSLAQCLVCSKTWRDATLPVLYSDICLQNSNLEKFVRQSDISNSVLVQSLTIIIEPVNPAPDSTPPYPSVLSIEDIEYAKHHGSQESAKLWHLLEQLLDNLSEMNHSLTFSLTVSPGSNAIGFWIARPTITAITKALPGTCISIEIDTRGKDYFEPGSEHLCDVLRAILPRLQNLRLRVSTMCPAILGHNFNPFEPTKEFSLFRPVAAPNLETLVINCIPGTIFGSQAHICNTFRESPYSSYSTNLPEARTALVDALCLAHENIGFPVAKHIKLIYALPGSPGSNDASYASLNQCDILNNLTWALPFKNILGGGRLDSFLIRTPEGQEFLSYPWAIEAIAEGEIWAETMAGYRLPASATHYAAYVPKPLPLLDSVAWRALNPRKSCLLWYNEKLCGSRLLIAGRRQGFSGIVPPREATPAGWGRIRDGAQLQKN